MKKELLKIYISISNNIDEIEDNAFVYAEMFFPYVANLTERQMVSNLLNISIINEKLAKFNSVPAEELTDMQKRYIKNKIEGKNIIVSKIKHSIKKQIRNLSYEFTMENFGDAI